MKRTLYIYLLIGFFLSPTSGFSQRIGFGAWFDVPVGLSIVSTESDVAIPRHSYKSFYIRDKLQVHPVINALWGFKAFLDYRRFTFATAVGASIRHSTLSMEMPLGDGTLSIYKIVVKESGPYLPLTAGYVFANTRRMRFSASLGISYMYALTRYEDQGTIDDITWSDAPLLDGILYTDNRHLISNTFDLQAGFNWKGFYIQMGPRYERRLIGVGEGKTHPGFLTISFETTVPILKNLKGYRVYINDE